MAFLVTLFLVRHLFDLFPSRANSDAIRTGELRPRPATWPFLPRFLKQGAGSRERREELEPFMATLRLHWHLTDTGTQLFSYTCCCWGNSAALSLGCDDFVLFLVMFLAVRTASDPFAEKLVDASC